jgi:predicted nicotinamide N-methyase
MSRTSSSSSSSSLLVPSISKSAHKRKPNRSTASSSSSSSSSSIFLFEGNETLCPLIQETVSISISKKDAEFPIEIVKPPSIDELYEWYRKYGTGDEDPSWADIWPTERFLAKCLTIDSVAETTVMEIGAGLGFAGLIVAKYMKKKVLFLDREPLALHCALSSARVNDVEVVHIDRFMDEGYTSNGCCAASVFDWSKPSGFNLLPKCDLLIAGDVLYDPATALFLAKACKELAKSCLICELRRERAFGIIGKFLGECQKLGAIKAEIDESKSNEEYVVLVVEF